MLNITQVSVKDERRDTRVRGQFCNRLVVFIIAVIKDTERLERLGGLEVIVVVGERHLEGILGR